MNYYKLRAKTVNGGDVYQFDVSDIPVRIRETSFVLMNKPGSPILWTSPITCFTEYKDIWEGDILEHDGVLYAVIFQDSAYILQDKNGNTLPLDTENCTKVSTIYEDDSWKLEFETPAFKFNRVKFYLFDILGSYGDKCRIKKVKELVDPHEFQQYSRMDDMYFGDIMQGFPVCLRNGLVCLNK